MGDRYDLAGDELVRHVCDLLVRVDDEDVVGLREGEGLIELRPRADCDAQGLEALEPGAVEDLEGGVRTDRGDDDVLVVLEDGLDRLAGYHYPSNTIGG